MSRLSRRYLLRNVALGAAAIGAGTIRRARAQQTGPIRIPYIVALSGPMALIGAPIQMGAQIIADIINKSGGLAGRPLELIFRDDKLKPDETVAAAREMIGDGHNVIIAGLTGPTTNPLLPIMRETKTVLMTTAIGLPVTHELYNRYVFRCQDDEYQRVRALAKLAADRFSDIQTWGATLSDTATYRTSYASFSKILTTYLASMGKSAKFADPILCTIGTPDYRTQIAQLGSQNVQGIFNIVSASDGVTKGIKAVADQAIDVGAARALRLNLPPNLWSLKVWDSKLYPHNPISRALYDGYVARTKDTVPSDYIAYGNVPLFAIAAGIKAANGSTDSDSLIAALEGLKFNTAKGEVFFRKEDHQAILDSCFVEWQAQEQDPGFRTVDSYKIAGSELVEPPSPGVPFIP